MSESRRSFWSTVPGFVTGLAGLLTAIVGLVTVLIQLDVIGGDDGDRPAGTTETTVAGGGQGSGGAGAPTTTEVPRFTVSPAALDFNLTDQGPKTVTVKNTSDSASVTLSQQVTGQDAAQFSVSAGTCSGPLRANLSCELRVTFTPAGPLRTYKAFLQVTGSGARGQEVPLTASTLL